MGYTIRIKTHTGGEIELEGTLNFILQELRNINSRFDNLEEGQTVLCERVGSVEKRVGSIEGGQLALYDRFGNIEVRVGNIEKQVTNIDSQVGDIDNELKDFRVETRTSLQVIQTGQQGVREEITQRFRETTNSLQTIQKDTELTYQKISLHDLKFNRLESKSDKK